MNCKHCNRQIDNPGSLAAHEKACWSNPGRQGQSRSPLAGAKKGSTPWNKGKRTQANQHLRTPSEKVFCEDSKTSRTIVRRRVLADELIEYSCSVCGIGPEWNGKPMPLILDHINGINNDNRIKNLRFMCSNCDSQLPTYKARNKTKEGARLVEDAVLKTVGR